MHQKGDIAAQVGGEFAIFGGQQESFRRSVGALLLSGCVHLFNSFSAVVQHHLTVSLERAKKMICSVKNYNFVLFLVVVGRLMMSSHSFSFGISPLNST